MANEVEATLLTEVKEALRITTTRFDGEITTLILACKADLKLAGLSVLEATDPMIKRAIVLYSKANFGYDNPDSEKFQKSYDLLKMSLALASDYNGGSGDG